MVVIGFFDTLLEDTVQACKVTVRARSVSGASVLALATGVAALATLGIVGYATMIRPLQWAESNRLVRPVEYRNGREGRVPASISNGTYHSWLTRMSTIESLAGWRSQRMTLAAFGVAERIQVTWASPSLFEVLRDQPAIGRSFRSDEAGAGQGGPVILSNALWRSKFAARSDILGMNISLDDRPFTVVGVMGESWNFPEPATGAWIAWQIPTALSGPPGKEAPRMVIFAALARLRSGATVEQAAEEATASAVGAPDAGMAAVAMFGEKGPISVQVQTLKDALNRQARPIVLLLLVGATALFVCAIANVSNLQIGAALGRERDIALRLTLGARPSRVKRQLIIEMTMISAISGVVGLALAAATVLVLRPLLPELVTALTTTSLMRVGATVSAVAALACGVSLGCPFLFHTRSTAISDVSGAQVLRGELGRAGIERVLVVAQIATSSALIIISVGVAESVIRLVRTDRGYEPDAVYVAQLPFPRTYPAASRERVVENLLATLVASPSVRTAAVSNALPLVSAGGFTGFAMPSPDGSGAVVQVDAAHRVVSPHYFQALGVRLVQGRFLDETDTSASRPVVVVNQTFARDYLRGDAMGAQLPLRLGGVDAAGWEVVGIVGDTMQTDAAGHQPEVYVSYKQAPIDSQRVSERIVIAKASSLAGNVANDLILALRREDPTLAFDRVTALSTLLATEQREARLGLITTAAFAVCAWLVASIGIVALFSRRVAMRAKEYGVRLAIGASPLQLKLELYRQTLLLAVVGVVFGAWAAWASVRWTASIVGLATPGRLSLLLLTAGLCVLSCLVAVSIPAFRAAATDPSRLLRSNP